MGWMTSPGEVMRMFDEADERDNVPVECRLDTNECFCIPSRIFTQWGWKGGCSVKAVVTNTPNAIELVADENSDLVIYFWKPITLDKKFMDALGCEAGDTIVFERLETSILLRRKSL
ncbi:MAG: AbrB/MazE/SpoVT family DNA-binding domain-containing protein [Defluviitaleaceae bacterium]|nr:AbrB/MazE/SpoVT family DNA-binding domain-containing protein [Defluviitaleaceae bacterium]